MKMHQKLQIIVQNMADINNLNKLELQINFLIILKLMKKFGNLVKK